MIDRFIKIVSVLRINVYKNRTTDKARDARDRKTQQEHRTSTRGAIHTRSYRRIFRQEKHGRVESECMQSIFRQLYQKGACSQYGQSTRSKKEHDTRRERSIQEAEGNRTKECRIILPSFLFSYQSLLILQSIDDICFHINIYLYPALLEMYKQ